MSNVICVQDGAESGLDGEPGRCRGHVYVNISALLVNFQFDSMCGFAESL